MVVGFQFPHGPWYTPPAEYWKYAEAQLVRAALAWEEDLKDVKITFEKFLFSQAAVFRKANKMRNAMGAYLSAIAHLDANLGQPKRLGEQLFGYDTPRNMASFFLYTMYNR